MLERAARLLSRAGQRPWLLLLLMMLLVGAISAFMNHTAAVAIFLPLVLPSARLRKIAPSKLLIPPSYAAQFGGVCTLIGTSTNILVSHIAETQGVRAFTMFELGQVGLPLTLAGTVFVMMFGRWLPEPPRSQPWRQLRCRRLCDRPPCACEFAADRPDPARIAHSPRITASPSSN